MLLREVVKKQWVQENRISHLTTEEEKPSGMGQQMRADGQKQARGRKSRTRLSTYERHTAGHCIFQTHHFGHEECKIN